MITDDIREMINLIKNGQKKWLVLCSLLSK
jgi:hypothetical protein